MPNLASSRLLGSAFTMAQVVSVMVGVVIAVFSFNSTREREADSRKLEAMKPFLSLRQELYKQALDAAAVLTNPGVHSEEEKQAAKKQFRDLYVARLSMVECPAVESKMVDLAKKIDPELVQLNEAQDAAYKLAHALRDSFVTTWKVECPPEATP